jgi:hypothetical protein
MVCHLPQFHVAPVLHGAELAPLETVAKQGFLVEHVAAHTKHVLDTKKPAKSLT